MTLPSNVSVAQFRRETGITDATLHTWCKRATAQVSPLCACRKYPSRLVTALVEWLHSPVVYRDDELFSHDAKWLVSDFHQTEKGVYHYLSLAKSNYRGYLRHKEVPLKKYFYVLRLLLAIDWLKPHQEPAPVEFDR